VTFKFQDFSRICTKPE